MLSFNRYVIFKFEQVCMNSALQTQEADYVLRKVSLIQSAANPPTFPETSAHLGAGPV